MTNVFQLFSPQRSFLYSLPNHFSSKTMVKVLIIGAAGYIGLHLSQQLRRANHIVYGTTRSANKQALLQANEIIPIVGPIEVDHHQPAAWMEAIKTENIEVVIDLAALPNSAKVILEPVIRLSKERQSAHLPKIGFIYCSGMWVHGSSLNLTSDLVPVGTKTSPFQPPDFVRWRPEIEHQVLASYEHLNAAIIRPSVVYGGTGRGTWDIYFTQIFQDIQNNKASISLPADPDCVLALVHVDDVASAFVAAVGKLELVSGHKDSYPVFDVSTSHESLALILQRFATEMGYKGKVELTGVPKGNGMLELRLQAFNTSVNIGSTRAKTMLGWTPTMIGMAAGIQIYAKSWLGGFLEQQHLAK